jgi:two-component system, response regulator PdtaR
MNGARAEVLVEKAESDNTARSVLVVDENRPWASALVAALADAGSSASAVDGVLEAIAAVETTRPALVVVGLGSPAKGLFLARTLHERFDVPFVVLSASQDEKIVHRAIELGAIAHLVKPQEARQCIPAIETAFARAEDLWRLRQQTAQLSLALQQNRATGMAIGILMERLRLDRDHAFETLRRHARSHRRSVTDVAEQFLSSAETLNQILPPGSRTQDQSS